MGSRMVMRKTSTVVDAAVHVVNIFEMGNDVMNKIYKTNIKPSI